MYKAINSPLSLMTMFGFPVQALDLFLGFFMLLSRGNRALFTRAEQSAPSSLRGMMQEVLGFWFESVTNLRLPCLFAAANKFK